jgi:hypothetical protein
MAILHGKALSLTYYSGRRGAMAKAHLKDSNSLRVMLLRRTWSNASPFILKEEPEVGS